MSIDRFIGGGIGGVIPPPVGQGGFSQPRGVAVNHSTGDVYTVEGLSTVHRVSRYSVEGEFELMWGRGVDNGAAAAQVCTTATLPCQGGGTGSLKGEFSTPAGIAIDQSDGSVYVHDVANRRVQKFDADGNFLLMFGKGVNAGTGSPDVCTNAGAPTDVCQAGSAGVAAGQIGNGNASTSGGRSNLAVHPVTGDVFLGDPGAASGATQNRRVMQWNSAGVFVRAWGFGIDTGATAFEVCTTASVCQGAVTAAGTGNGQFSVSQPVHIAVDGEGVVYVSDTNVGNRIIRFDSDEFAVPGSALRDPILATDQVPAGPLFTAPTTGLALDSSSGNLLVARDPSSGETRVQEIDPAPVPTLADSHAVGAGLTTVQGIASNGPGDRLMLSYASTVPGQGLFYLDADGPTLPVLNVAPASGVGSDVATLHGSVDPNGYADYRFEYSTDGVNWTTPAGSPTPPSPLTGLSTINVAQTATGLKPNTLYRVRVVVTQAFGGDANGPAPTLLTESSELSFISDAVAPTVTTLPAASQDTSATLAGTINPNGSLTSYRFEWGTTTSYGSKMPVPDGFAGSSTNDQDILAPLTGLDPNKTYHYRLVATNPAGTTTGQDQEFHTRPVATPPPGRGYELVSPADKPGGIGVGVWYKGPGNISSAGFGAYDGERFAAHSMYGATLQNDGALAFADDWAFADRIGDSVGWRSHSPITHPGYGAQAYRFAYISDASDDLSLATWSSNAGLLKIFPEIGPWNGSDVGASFVADWAGRWEIFGPTSLDQLFMPTTTPWRSETVVSSDTPLVLGSGHIGGMAGPGDPTHPNWPDRVSGRVVYADDVSAGLSDSFPGAGVRRLVNECTDGTTIPSVNAAGKIEPQLCPPANPGRDSHLISDRGATVQAGQVGDLSKTGFDDLVSSDGKRAFFMSPDPLTTAPGFGGDGQTACRGFDPSFNPSVGVLTQCPAQLYVSQRAEDGHLTRWISRPEDGLLGQQAASLLGQARFEGASGDGDKVFFRTNSPLTADDPNGGVQVPGGVISGIASNNSWDLYMYDVPDDPDADPGDGTLTRVSAGPTGTGDGNGLQASDGGFPLGQGMLRAVSDDGMRAYFVVSGALPGVPGPSNGTSTAPGGSATTADATNLYYYDARSAQADRWRFVTRLPRSTSTAGPSACASTGTRSGGPLRVAAGPSPEVIVDGNRNCVRATADGTFVTFWTTGRLTADDPDNSTGDVYAYDATADRLTRVSAPQGGIGGTYTCDSVAGMQCFGDGGYDDMGPATRVPMPALGVVTDPSVSGDRIAFFQSRSRLVAEDVDDAFDVYMWRNGGLSLVSTGASDTDGAFYKGNSADGKNVYLVTRDRLTWQDVDAVADVYSARVDGGIEAPVVPVLCGVLGGDCQGPDGGGVSSSVGTDVAEPGGDEVSVRKTVSLVAPSLAARRRAARTGRLSLAVRVSGAGRVSAVARARIGRRARQVAVGSARLAGAGDATVRLRLSRVARQRLRRGLSLRMSVRVESSGARARTIAVLLPGAAR
jgi:hypothetical protein